MAKRIVAIYDRGIDKNLMQGFDVLEKYGYELTLVEKTVNEDELAYQNSMLSVEVNGPDGTPINEEVFQYLDDAEIVVTGYGICGRIARSAVKLLRAEGYKVGFIRPKTLYPFPADVYAGLDFDRVKAILDVEMGIPAQMVDDIRLAINDRCPIETCLHAGGEIMGRGEVMDAVRKLLER